MTKKLRRIFSPKFISLGETFRAEGAMMSLSSRAPASKISLGKIEEISSRFASFLKSESKIPMLFHFNRLLGLAGVEGLVEKFDYFLRAKPRHTYARAHQTLFDH